MKQMLQYLVIALLAVVGQYLVQSTEAIWDNILVFTLAAIIAGIWSNDVKFK